MAHYNLIFQGKIIDGASLNEVKDNVARLFKADAAKTAALFSGKPIVIKKNLDTDAAKKYLAVLKKAGAIVKAVKLDSKTDENPQKTIPVSTPTSTSSNEVNKTSTGLSPGLASLMSYNQPNASEPQEESNEVHSEADNSDLQLAPLGSNHTETTAENRLKDSIPDTSHLSISDAQSGSLEEFTPEIEAVELPDIDALSMSEANTGSLEEFSQPVVAVDLPDISTLDISEQDGTPLSDQSPITETIEIPDISDLSMSEAQEGSLEGLGIKVDAVTIPDTSHLEIEKTPETGQADEKPMGKATFQIN